MKYMNGVPVARVLSVPLEERASDRLAALFEAHYDRLHRLARRLAPSADAARDLVQDTFLRAARSPRSIPDGARDEEAWLVRVLINVQRDQWRRRLVRARHDRLVRTEPHATGDVEAELVARATVWRALDALTPHRRAIVVMHELEGLDTRAIARTLDIAAVTVRWHLLRGRRELARALGATPGERDEDR